MQWKPIITPVSPELAQLVQALNERMQALIRDLNRRQPKILCIYYENNIPNGIVDGVLKYHLGSNEELIIPRSGFIHSLAAQVNGAILTGSITLKPSINGNQIGPTLTLNSTQQRGVLLLEQDLTGEDNFIDGTIPSTVGCMYSTVGLSPLTLDLQVTILVELTSEDTV